MKILSPLVALLLTIQAPVFAVDPPSTPTIAIQLKPRQPNWRYEIIEAFPSGHPKRALFFEPVPGAPDRPVKEVLWH